MDLFRNSISAQLHLIKNCAEIKFGKVSYFRVKQCCSIPLTTEAAEDERDHTRL